MADKDLLAIIADTLRKLDQQGERLELHGKILEMHGETLERQGIAIERQGEAIERQGKVIEKQGETILKINETLTDFMDVSIKHFEEQESFNKRFLSGNKEILNRLDSIETTLNRTSDIEPRVKRLEAAVFK